MIAKYKSVVQIKKKKKMPHTIKIGKSKVANT